MLRRLISILIIGLCACDDILVDNAIFSDRDFLETMVVDFEVVQDPDFPGSVILIDKSSKVGRVEWEVEFEKPGFWIDIYERALPGDTVNLLLFQSGKYVITLTGTGEYLNGYEKRVVEKKVIKVIDVQIVEEELLTPYLKEIRLLDYPTYDNNGLFWDPDNSGPDITLKLYRDFFTLFEVIEPVGDLTKDKLPYSFVLPIPLRINNARYDVYFRDQDTIRENIVQSEIVLSTSFNVFSFGSTEKDLGEETLSYNNIELIIEWREE